MDALGRLAPTEWRDWHAASGPGRGDSAFEHFSWKSSKRHLRFRFTEDSRTSELQTCESKLHPQCGEASTWRDPWAGYEPHRAVRGALGLRLKGQCTLDDDLAAMAAAIAAGAAATRCAARTYSWEDDRERQGYRLVDVFDALLVEICHALHAEARGSALERVGGPATTSAVLMSPLDVVSPPKKVGALALLARRSSTSAAVDEGVSEARSNFRSPESVAGANDEKQPVPPLSTGKGLLKTPSAAGIGGFAKSTLLGATMVGATSATSGKIQRARRCKQLADLALLATCADDALARASEAYVELRADGLHWQAGALVTWCAAAVAAIGDDLGVTSVAATMPVPPLSFADHDIEGNGLTDDAIGHERTRAVDDSRSYTRRCVEAAAAEASVALERLGTKGSPLLAELLFKLAKWRISDAAATAVAKAMTRTLEAVEDACLGAVETARIALAATVLCARASSTRKAAVLAADAARNCTELQNWAGAVVAWRLADRCTTGGWTMVRQGVNTGLTVAASRAGDAIEHVRSLSCALQDLSGLCRATRIPCSDFVPIVTALMPVAAAHKDNVAGTRALLARWFDASLFAEARPSHTPPYIDAIVVRPPRCHGRLDVGAFMWKADVERIPAVRGSSCLPSGATGVARLTSSDGKSDVKSAFFYNPFLKKRAATLAAERDDGPSGWVVGERCSASVMFKNPLSVPIFVQDVRLVIEGAFCACHPSSITTFVEGDEPLLLNLEVTPLEPADDLAIVGVVARLALTSSTPRRLSRLVFLAFAPHDVEQRIWPPLRNQELAHRTKPAPNVTFADATSRAVIVKVVPPQPRFNATMFPVGADYVALTSILSVTSRPGEVISLTLRLDNLTSVTPRYFELAARKAGATRKQILFNASADDVEEVAPRGRYFYEIFDPLDSPSRVRLRASLADEVITLKLRLARDLAGSGFVGEVVVSYAATSLACRYARLPFVFEPAPNIRVLNSRLRRPTRLVCRGDRVETADNQRRCLVTVIANDADFPVSIRLSSKSRWILIAAKAAEIVLFCESSADVRSASIDWHVCGSPARCYDGAGTLNFDVDQIPTDELGDIHLGLHYVERDRLSLMLRASLSNIASEALLRNIILRVVVVIDNEPIFSHPLHDSPLSPEEYLAGTFNTDFALQLPWPGAFRLSLIATCAASGCQRTSCEPLTITVSDGKLDGVGLHMPSAKYRLIANHSSLGGQ
mmetsp:Transcript_25419/g.82222  ORF Transcript_25419/g.82222 Transcript_25419/m.82222 type:complete len:1210 (-) Transcript_25419:1029-4658(-)